LMVAMGVPYVNAVLSNGYGKYGSARPPKNAL
jgi:hypothetical protein